MKKVRKVLPMMKCDQCGESFLPQRKWARFCSASCRVAHYESTHPRISAVELERLRNADQSHQG